MRRLSILVVMIALVGGQVVPTIAHDDAGTGDEPPTGGRGFVGSWNVTIAVPGEPGDPHLASFGADGTFVEAARPVQPAPADAPFVAIFPSPGHGAWGSAGEGTAVLVFTRLLSNEKGEYLGTVPARATVELSADGQRFTGPLTFEVADAAGTLIDTGRGTLSGTRIGIEPAGTPTAGRAAITT